MENDIRRDSEVILIEKNIPTFVEKVKSLQITNEPTSKIANDLMLAIDKQIKKLEGKRKFFVMPLNEGVKRINNEAKLLTEPLREALRMIKGKMLDWQVKLRKKREEEEAKRSKGVADLLDEKPEKEEVKSTVRSPLGQSFTKKIWSYEVKDFSKIPDSYKLLDKVKVNATIRAHTTRVEGESKCDLKIEGLRIYQAEQLAMK